MMVILERCVVTAPRAMINETLASCWPTCNYERSGHVQCQERGWQRWQYNWHNTYTVSFH